MSENTPGEARQMIDEALAGLEALHAKENSGEAYFDREDSLSPGLAGRLDALIVTWAAVGYALTAGQDGDATWNGHIHPPQIACNVACPRHPVTRRAPAGGQNCRYCAMPVKDNGLGTLVTETPGETPTGVCPSRADRGPHEVAW